VNLFEDGDIWSTINGIKHFLLPGYIPGITHFDDYLPDDSAAWKAHTQRILNSGKTIVKNEEEIENKNDSFDGQMLKVRVLQGMFYPLKTDNFFRLTWKGAFCTIFKIYLGRIKERRLNRRIVKTSLPKEAVLESLESKKEFEQAINSESKSKISAPIVSAILFIVISAYFFDVLFTLALFAVLALHEAGHWITMKWLGHNNVAVYFIPLLGAVTIGESKKIISPMMQLLTYLAGPLPGILLAFAIIKILPASAPYTFLNMFFSILLYVNCFNLLPLFPLDGGRIVDTFLLSRMPRLRFCFALLSTIVLCIITLSYTFFSIACVFISILLFIFLPTQRHLLRLRLAIGRVDAVSESEAKEIILNALESPKFEKWSDSKRNTMLDIMVSELINTKMNLIQVFITAVIYGLSLYLSYVLEIFAVL
jgi:Zn-dependent protease